MEKTVNDLILGALDRLSADQLDRFKRTPSAGIGYGLIEKESNMAVTKRIIEKFTRKNAIAHTAKVLREIDLNNQAEDLEEAYALPARAQPAVSLSKMAEAGDLLDQDQSSCSICLDLLRDPVAIPCGHSYCMGCIKACWDRNDDTGVYSCPQCRQTYTPRPVLNRNTMLAEVVEKLKKTGLQAAPPAHCYAGPGDVACDFCTGRKRKAAKSCLVSVASYCETHLQPHYESPALKKRKLTPATGYLQEKICCHHDKLLEVYCRTDQQCICYLCLMDEHKGHDTVPAAAERTEKQKQLGATQRKSQQRIQEREKVLLDLRQAADSLTRSAQAAMEDSESIFTELFRYLERRHSEVKELIRDQEKAAVSRAERLIEQLEQEIAELRRRETLSWSSFHTQRITSISSRAVSLSVPLLDLETCPESL
ncbi:hypothetical protein AAFF_G00277010, partial [Aldrovandia affinis]